MKYKMDRSYQNNSFIKRYARVCNITLNKQAFKNQYNGNNRFYNHHSSGPNAGGNI